MSKINIYGQLENQAVDQKLAVTRQIYDESFSKFQSDLNRSFIPLLSGTSLQRPANPGKGQPFFDRTLGMTIWYNGSIWIDSNGDNADIPRKGDTSERPNPKDVSVGFQYYDTTLKRLLTSNGTEWVVNPDSNLYWVSIDEDGNISNREELTQQTLWQEI